MSFTNDLAAFQSAVSQAGVRSQVAYAVAGKQLDAQRQAGNAATQLLEAAAQLSRSIGVGQNFDGQA